MNSIGLRRFSRCLYVFHIHCASFSFPETVKHKNHYHRLTLTKSVEEADPDDYYCDAYETRRNPMYPVYYARNVAPPLTLLAVLMNHPFYVILRAIAVNFVVSPFVSTGLNPKVVLFGLDNAV